MAVITVPNLKWAAPRDADWGLRNSVFLTTSPLDGVTKTVEILGAPKWVTTLNYNNQPNADRARLEGLFASLRVQGNRLSMGHPLRRVPTGTMRGSPTIASNLTQFGNNLNITGTGTLMAGDMLGVNGQLLMVTADNPSLTSVPISPPLRAAVSAGTTVVWDWPRALFIADGAEVRLPVAVKVSGPFSVSLVEVFS